ncbi:MAG: response regulator [Acetobacteraceae bacterium]|nr:response regulator [Acetobacteraceae bacterium]
MPLTAAATHQRANASLLLAEDEEDLRDALTALLDRAGHSVIGVATAQAAIEQLTAGAAVDVLVTDMSMPGMDGVTLINEARRLRPGLPAILVTGFARLSIGGTLGGDYEVLHKPVPFERLLACIDGLLAQERN